MSGLITVAFGGPSLEHDVSILTGLQAERYLRRSDATVQCLYWDRAGRWHLVPPNSEARDYLGGAPRGSEELELRFGGTTPGFSRRRALRSVEVDVGAVLSCFHGGLGEGGGSQALWELAGIPATGGTVQAAALGMDKLAFGAVMATAGVPVLPRTLVEEGAPPAFAGPYIVKPRFGGSSIGIAVAADYESALALAQSSPHLRSGALVEPFRPDLYDLNVSYRTYPQFETSALERPIRPEGSEFYTFDDKYIRASGLASAPREIPAQVSPELEGHVRELARRVATLTGLPGLARVDFLTDGTTLFVNEVNSIPGAMALYLWPDADPVRLLLDLVAETRQPTRRAPTTGIDEGAALRAAGGIAGKLLPVKD